MPRVNAAILRWAREASGLSAEDAVHKLGIADAHGTSALDRLHGLESGTQEPTRPLLVKMARVYHRPLVVFYLDAPPRKGTRGEDYRTLPERDSTADEALIDALLRNVQARQALVRATLIDEQESTPLAFVGSMRRSDGVQAISDAISATLQISREEYRRQADTSAAFKYLRTRAELAGVFVLLMGDLGSHHSAIKVSSFRGFCLADNIAPFIVINDHDAPAAWSFTLLHELVHLWLGQTGIGALSFENEGEKFCSDVASAILLPDSELPDFPRIDPVQLNGLLHQVSDFARNRRLSHSLVAYRLYRSGRINWETWSAVAARLRQHWHEGRDHARSKARERDGGPNFYVVRRHRLGTHLLNFAERMMMAGALSTSRASRILGVKPQQVSRLMNTSSTSSGAP